MTLEITISFNKHFHSGIATKNIESDLLSFYNTRVETTLSLKVHKYCHHVQKFVTVVENLNHNPMCQAKFAEREVFTSNSYNLGLQNKK